MKHKRRGTVSFCTKTSWKCSAFYSSNSRVAMKFRAAGSVADRKKTQEMWANQKRPDINAHK